MSRPRLALGALALLLLLLGADTVYRAGPSERTDLPVYLAGARRVLAGEDPLLVESGRGWPYVYPPTLAVLLIPLTALPLRVAAGLWFLLSAAAAGLGWWAWLAARRPEGSPAPPAARDLWPWLLVALPCTSALLRGQTGPLLLGLLLGAAACLLRKRDALAGALVALAAAIKLTPALVIVGLAAARRWRALAGAAAGLALWLALVPLPFLGARGTAAALEHFTRHMVLRPVRNPGEPDLTSRNVHVGNNQSLSSLAIRHLEGRARTLTLSLLLLGAVGVALGLSLGGAGEVAPSEGAWALLVAAPLLVAPIAWHHHHVLLLPALAFLCARPERSARAALVGFALLSLLHFAVPPLRPLGLLGLGTLWVFLCVAALSLRPGVDEGEPASAAAGPADGPL
ncbi:MAG: glycosyltransferase 87 family protein [Planctomycetota bacterium]